MPERDIESLGVMGWGLEAARKFFRRRRRRRRRPPYFSLNDFWTLIVMGRIFYFILFSSACAPLAHSWEPFRKSRYIQTSRRFQNPALGCPNQLQTAPG